MQHNNTPEGELSYFETALLLHLRKSHPHMAGNPNFLRSRADEAANVYEHSIRDGLTVPQALGQSEVVSEWFPEVPPEKRKGLCLGLLPSAEAVFNKYPIDDRFEASPSYRILTIELTGFIQSNIEQYGI